jgi:hypothetical protein
MPGIENVPPVSLKGSFTKRYANSNATRYVELNADRKL